MGDRDERLCGAGFRPFAAGLPPSNQRLAAKLAQLEHKLDDHDAAIRDILDAIRQLMLPPDPPKKRQIGFVRDE